MNIKRTPTGYRLGNLECTGLPPRQSQTLLLRARGAAVADAAALMGCGAQTIRNNTATLFYKLGANNIAGLITSAFERGNLHIVKTLAVMVIALNACLTPYATGTEQEMPRPRARQSARIRRQDELPPLNLGA